MKGERIIPYFTDNWKSFLDGRLPKDIEEFRDTWKKLSADVREAVALDQYNNLLYELKSDHRGDKLESWLHGIPPKLELLVRESDKPVRPFWLCRDRWIDHFLPTLRADIWQSLNNSLRTFASEVDKLGGEREQVGSLLTYIMQGLRENGQQLKSSLRGPGKVSGELRVDRYVFKTSEEHRWGPDFAMVMSFTAPDGFSVARYVLFQAKLIEGPSIKVDIAQLRNLLRASWHSSFYIAWKPDLPPVCVQAEYVDGILDAGKAGSGKVSSVSPRVRWERVKEFGNTFADLFADRFLCGEIGDPLGKVDFESISEVAEHLGRTFGPLPYGVLGFAVRAAYESEPDVQIGAEWQELDIGYPSDEGDVV